MKAFEWPDSSDPPALLLDFWSCFWHAHFTLGALNAGWSYRLYDISHFANSPDCSRVTWEQSDRLPRAQFLYSKLILGSPRCVNVFVHLILGTSLLKIEYKMFPTYVHGWSLLSVLSGEVIKILGSRVRMEETGYGRHVHRPLWTLFLIHHGIAGILHYMLTLWPCSVQVPAAKWPWIQLS